MSTCSNSRALRRQIKARIILLVAGLIASGLTAFPIEWELHIAHNWFTAFQWSNDFTNWIVSAYQGIKTTNDLYPFISYGSDWLGFAHLMIAVAFLGPLRDPVKNRWVIEFGIVCCIAIFPFAFIAGEVRGIPVFWRLIDCSFGIAGGLILLSCYKKIGQLEKMKLLKV
jgi:hypothetical protein